MPESQQPTTRPEAARTVVAEKRGNYLFLALATADGSTAQCFFDAADPSTVDGMTGGSTTAASPLPKPLSADGLEAAGAGSAGGPEGTYAFTQGRVGTHVTAVTIRSEGHTVQATVTDGYFAAWWPSKPTPAVGPSPIVAYDITLADGRVLTDVPESANAPARPTPGPRQIGLVERGGGVSEKGEVATVAGHVGAEVRGVTINVGGQRIVATVTDGTFRAEWPNPVAAELPDVTYDLTLADGSVLRNQKPVSGIGS